MDTLYADEGTIKESSDRMLSVSNLSDVDRSFYVEEVLIGELCDRVTHYAHLCTLYWWLRYSLLHQLCGIFNTQMYTLYGLCNYRIIFGIWLMEYLFRNDLWLVHELCSSCAVVICLFFRPFGSSAILGGYDRDGPQLYMIEPSGVAYVRLLMALYFECIIIFMKASGLFGGLMLSELMPSITFHYKYANVLQQPDDSSCGVFALAYATDIAYKINLETSIYNISDMRQHLRDYITQSKIIPFPKQNIMD